jgi:hypothetical protein
LRHLPATTANVAETGCDIRMHMPNTIEEAIRQ